MRDRRYIFSIGLITMVILAAGGILWNSGTVKPAIDDTGTAWYLGPEEAPVRIDMYPDFMCGICVEKERLAIQAFYAFPGKIRLVYHHYAGTPVSQMIAEALEAAGEQDEFWSMHDRLAGAGDDVHGDIYHLTTAAESMGMDVNDFIFDRLTSEADNLGLDVEEFIQAIMSGCFSEKVRLAKQEALSAGIIYAAVFINGIEFKKYPAGPEDFFAVVTEELDRLVSESGN